MSNGNIDPLYYLIKSLTKAEKRSFKIYASRNGNPEDLKYIILFDYIDKHKEYDEEKILEKEKELKPAQLSNLKAHLYKQILQSLRITNPENSIYLTIREMVDYTQLLYNRCLYDQSIKMLEKAKALAIKYDKNYLLYEILDLEKKLVTRFIKTNIEEHVTRLICEIDSLKDKLSNISDFSNLTLKLYSFYIKIGFIRNQKEFELANSFLYSTLPVFKEELLSFTEKMHLYNTFTGYYFFTQDFQRGYEYAQKMVSLFDSNPQYILPKIEMYIKSINNLLLAQEKLSKYDEFLVTVEKFDSIANVPDLTVTPNIELLLFKYGSTHKINKYFLLGEFTEGTKTIPEISEDLEKFRDRLDKHYILIFYYKFACMYFGDSQHSKVIYWLNQVINDKDLDLRSDILCFARILSLISHYELKNMDLIDYHIKSTYRFLAKKEDLHLFQKIVLKFLKRLGSITPAQLPEAFQDLHDQLLPLEQTTYEKRAFMYFDILSWLESKIERRNVQEVIQEKTQKRIRHFY
ncbi:MAG: hypothetical protein EHM93_08205 [Bacteroidales bacterium]|nr:MAG: hypothetical protein EHM93_08205 [Bacteroidales bacterium]